MDIGTTYKRNLMKITTMVYTVHSINKESDYSVDITDITTKLSYFISCYTYYRKIFFGNEHAVFLLNKAERVSFLV